MYARQRRPSIKIEGQTTRRKEGDAKKKRKTRIKIKSEPTRTDAILKLQGLSSPEARPVGQQAVSSSILVS